jgi:Na+/H+-dicarboxylate symporter
MIRFKNMELWKKVAAGFVLGIIVGMMFGERAAFLGLLGEIFVRLIKMVMFPLIYISIVLAIATVEDTKSLSRITLKSLALFMVTACAAVGIGLLVAYILKPGASVSLTNLTSLALADDPTSNRQISLIGIVRNLIPDNALHALVDGKLLQVIFFAFFTGCTIQLLDKEKPVIIRGFTIGRNIVFKMVDLALKAAPFGAFGSMAELIGAKGLGALGSMTMLVLAFFLAIAIQYLLLGILIWLSNLSPLIFYNKSLHYQLIAISTSSSKATLPATMRVCSEKLGISRKNASFILPLGATINMSGTAIYLSVCALFFAQSYGMHLSWGNYMLLALASTLGSIGAAGIPSGSIMMLPMVLLAINIPIGGIAFIAGIDRVLDMFRTALNISGDAAVTLIVDKSEGTLNEKIYNDKRA